MSSSRNDARNMACARSFMEKLKSYGVGRRKLDDEIFNISERPPARLGVYDMDEENLCHDLIKIKCTVPGCHFSAESLLEFEAHYNSSHRYSCAQCKKILPSPHFLDLHLQENHDSFFAVMAQRKPSYCCYIEECKDKFQTTEERHDHAIKIHKLPKDFRFEQKPKSQKKNSDKNKSQMDIDIVHDSKKTYKVVFSNNKQKTFPKYTGRKFTKSEETKMKNEIKMEITLCDLKDSLPN